MFCDSAQSTSVVVSEAALRAGRRAPSGGGTTERNGGSLCSIEAPPLREDVVVSVWAKLRVKERRREASVATDGQTGDAEAQRGVARRRDRLL